MYNDYLKFRQDNNILEDKNNIIDVVDNNNVDNVFE